MFKIDFYNYSKAAIISKADNNRKSGLLFSDLLSTTRGVFRVYTQIQIQTK